MPFGYTPQRLGTRRIWRSLLKLQHSVLRANGAKSMPRSCHSAGEGLYRTGPWLISLGRRAAQNAVGSDGSIGYRRYWRTWWAQRVKRQLGSKQEAIHNGRLSTSRGWGQGQSRNGLTPEMGSLVRDALGLGLGLADWSPCQVHVHGTWCKWSFGEWRNFLSG
ncbi:hypothetical protein BDP81DRAFT_433754 [Colletotrichum phormii]|uniref:Uncharacterized protein n=1 Tax=Colletotrichum phormii TaxID=359342 RepID=A0AAI9ZLE9_9PEZI|nr:uncharacterized protein BDP81DRAFT_433754 [Colletotrichum phormii]KAK1634137.1 hypothetical protein BDP81DRAFT_433754 [Colletotrichum phormii]